MLLKIQKALLVLVLAGQATPLISSGLYYASELKESSETINSQVESTVNDESLNSEVNSETSTSQMSETTVESETAASETINSEISETINSEESETSSEEIIKSDSSEELEGINSKITIDKDGATEKTQAAVPTSFMQTDELEANENLTAYENQARLEANSGESTIKIEPTQKSKALNEQLKDTSVYYVMNDQGEISEGTTKQPRSYDGNLITVLNGTIIDSDSAIIRTSGGYDTTFYVYNSIEDLKNKTDGVPFSGGGFDGTFIETVEQDGIYYDHIKISGYEGYTEAGNIQIIPEQLMQARSYYAAEDGDWVYYSAIDPLTSTEYDSMAVSAAPSAANSGVKYYTDDDVNFYTEEILTNSQGIDPAVSYNSYFMNLPFRSESSYTATDYKNYLKSKGYTDSEYYNETTAFTKAQSLESINSLMIFAMANHESAYGRSSYARACYNFFGRGAVDSDPDQACQYYSYKTATDGILAQALFLENGYFDVLDWRYSGTHVGNKASGMNVKYASDSDWGKLISNHAYMMDQYKGGKEEDKYALLKVSGVKHVYKDSALTTNVKSSGDSGKLSFYDLSQMTGTSNTVNVVALKQSSSSYLIQVPTAVKNSSSVDCSYTTSKKGSYPNYEGRSKISVDTNTANYSCDYVSMANNQYWISKSGTSVINGKTVPPVTKNYYEYYSNGDIQFKFVTSGSSKEILYAYGYDHAGNIIAKYTYFNGTKYGSHVGKIQDKYTVVNGNVTVTKAYNTKQQLIYIYTYYSGATLSNTGSKIRYRFNIDSKGNIIDTNAYSEGSNRKLIGVFNYYDNTKYGEQGSRMKYYFKLKPGTLYIEKAYEYRNGSSKNGYSKIYTYLDNTKYGSQTVNSFYDVFWLKGKDKEIDYAVKYKNGKRYIKYLYDKGTIYGENHGAHIKSKYYY